MSAASSARRAARSVRADGVLRPVSTLRPGQVAACSASLLVAGILLTRGFIGVLPGRPVFVLAGLALAVSAVLGLAVDHVAVRHSPERPDEVLATEVHRSRRHGHRLALVSIECDEATGLEVVRRIRITDRAWRRRNRLVVLLVETDRAGVDGFVERIADLVEPVRVLASVFPDDAITVEGLEAGLRPAVAVGSVHLLGRRPRPVAPESGPAADVADLTAGEG